MSTVDIPQNNIVYLTISYIVYDETYLMGYYTQNLNVSNYVNNYVIRSVMQHKQVLLSLIYKMDGVY